MDILPVFKPRQIIIPAILKSSDTELMAKDFNLPEGFIKKCLTTIDRNPTVSSIEIVKEIDSIVARDRLYERCEKLFKIFKSIPFENKKPEFEHSILVRHLNRALYKNYNPSITRRKISIILLGNNHWKELQNVPIEELLLQINSQRFEFRKTFFK